MILLSNLHSNERRNERVISIKPIRVSRQEEQKTLTDNEPILKNDIERLHEEIKQQEKKLAEIKQQKEALVSETKKEIAEKKDEWATEKETYIERAKAEGYEAGLQLGQEEGKSLYDESLQQANEVIKRAKEEYHRILDDSERTIIDLAIYISEKILTESISEAPEKFIHVVKGAISEIKDQSSITIFLHSNNYKAVMDEKSALETLLNGETRLSIFVDHTLRENSCIIEHPLGEVDASVDTQLTEIRKTLMNVAKEKSKWI